MYSIALHTVADTGNGNWMPSVVTRYVTRPGHFLRIRQWGGHLQKGTILYQVWRNDRW